MNNAIVAISLFVMATLGASLIWSTNPPAVSSRTEARVPKGYASTCTFHRGDPDACLWRGTIHMLAADARGDSLGHESANPGHRCVVEEAE